MCCSCIFSKFFNRLLRQSLISDRLKCIFERLSDMFCLSLGSVHRCTWAEAPGGKTELHSLQPASPGPPRKSARLLEPQMKAAVSLLCLSVSPSVVCRNERRRRRRSRGGKSGWTRSGRKLWADYDPSERSGALTRSALPSPAALSELIKPGGTLHRTLLMQ